MIYLMISAFVIYLGLMVYWLYWSNKRDKESFKQNKEIMLMLIEALAKSEGIDLKKEKEVKHV